MNDAHTPGPWTVYGPKPADSDAYVEYDQTCLVMTTRGGKYRAMPAICNDIANARLVAASPELLELAKMIAEHAPGMIDGLPTRCPVAGRLIEFRDIARRLLDQVNGVPQ